MIVISHQVNRLGNRLWTFGHVIAHAMERRTTVLNPAFYEYADFFEATRQNWLCRYPETKWMPAPRGLRRLAARAVENLRRHSPGRRWTHRWVQVLDIMESHDYREADYDLAGPEFQAIRRQAPVTIVGGWLFRDYEAFGKHLDAVRHYFRPAAEHQANVAKLIAEARRDCDVLVGIHIRQGDYANAWGGRSYFQTSEYVAIMKRAMGQWPGKRVRFFICSNEAQSAELLSAVPHSLGSGHVAEDLYSLAACDYLIGVPSTYSMWAAFYGRVPTLHLAHPEQAIELSEFKRWDR